MKPVLSALTSSVAILIALGGCSVDARDQWRVSVTTDAPLPLLGNRLLVEVFEDNGAPACASCRRQFGLGEASRWPISFGVATPSGAAIDSFRLRSRLYRSEIVGADGLPTGAALIDLIAKFPQPDGITDVAIVLATNCFGVPSSLESGTTCVTETGRLGPVPILPRLVESAPMPVPGSWEFSSVNPCLTETPPGMICVPGGVFLLGSPAFWSTGDELDPSPERLVKLDPFFIDVDEFTVGAMADLVRQGSVSSEPILRGSDPTEQQAACTYLGVGQQDNDMLPLNCVTYELAQEACGALGKRLPTESEWEYVAGNANLETDYPWGNDANPCAHSLVGRKPVMARWYGDSTCLLADNGEAGLHAGGHPDDVTLSGVHNLGGSLSELLLDWFTPYSDACLSAGYGVAINPRCELPDWGIHSARGGAWNLTPNLSLSYERDRANGPAIGIGFRCVRQTSP